MSSRRNMIATALLFILPLTGLNAVQAGELPSGLKAGEHNLQLNGWGARSKSFLQLYVAGLYLTAPNQNPAKIAAADEPMAIRIKITSGFVSQSKMVDSLNEGFKKSTKGNPGSLAGKINEFRNCFRDPIKKGDTFTLVYTPQSGTVVIKNNQVKGSIASLEFKTALFNIWLSDEPADANLKQAMLRQGNRR